VAAGGVRLGSVLSGSFDIGLLDKTAKTADKSPLRLVDRFLAGVPLSWIEKAGHAKLPAATRQTNESYAASSAATDQPCFVACPAIACECLALEEAEAQTSRASRL